MSSSQAGGRKISGEEKNLANAQAKLFGLQTQQLQGLQSVLQGLQPSSYAALGLNPTTGQAYRPGELPTAPTAVANPGARPTEYRTVFTGKNWGKNDQAKQDQSLRDIQAWEAKNQQYQQYLQQQQAYDAQVQQIQQNPDSFYLPDPTAQRNQLESTFNQIMAGSLDPSQAYASGRLGTEAATQAGFAGQLRDIFGGTQAQDQSMASLLANYQNYLAGNTAENQTFNTLRGNYDQLLAGNIPEASQLANYLNMITTGQQGGVAINPAVQRALDDAEQAQRTRMFQQLGSGWETSTAGSAAMNDIARMRAGTIDSLNQQDMQNAVAGYSSLLSGAQSRQAQVANQMLGLGQFLEGRQANTLSQYNQLSNDKMNRTNTALNGYLGSSQASQARIMQDYANEWNKRVGQLGAYTQIATAPYQGVDYTNLINSYTGALNAATQRQTGPQQSGVGGALGSLAGTALGGGLGYLAGGPMGAMAGASLGSSFGGNAGSALGGGQGMQYQVPNLFNYGSGASNPYQLGSFQTNPFYMG